MNRHQRTMAKAKARRERTRQRKHARREAQVRERNAMIAAAAEAATGPKNGPFRRFLRRLVGRKPR